jgi:Na+/H+ antiporter NhaD/arsenite permease-like protein
MSLLPVQPASVLAILLLLASGSWATALAQEPDDKQSSPANEPELKAPSFRQATTKATAEETGHNEAVKANHSADHAAEHEAAVAAMGRELPLLTVVPFALMLLAIAIFPLANPHWWEHTRNQAIVVGLLSLFVIVYFLGAHGYHGGSRLKHLLIEYFSFIVLLTALYVISGGIYIKGSLSGTPLANTGMLALGAIIASFIGTTGASVLLIRPLLRANKTRVGKVHIVVFFIFIVSNCGGLLTPLGDPPLFLGFLKGVPFTWTFQLWQQWLLVNVALLVIFNIWDQLVFALEEKERLGSQLEEVLKHEPVSIQGLLNFLFLAGVVLTIYFSGQKGSGIDRPFVKEGIMIALALAAYFTTAPSNRQANNFTFKPIVEVAVLFIGIFITMGPALAILNAWGSGERSDLGAMPVKEVWHYFWAAGALSSFLDNAPTYLTFGSLACGEFRVPREYFVDNIELKGLLDQGPAAARILAAISCGAVFMGANTYIGNGPNFMVKAIAEENGVKMPSFFGYMAYSCAILIPIFIVVTFVFFR